MNVTKAEYVRKLKTYLDTRNWTDNRANERILRTVEEHHEINEQSADDFRRKFAAQAYLQGEEQALKMLLPLLTS